MSYNTGYIKFYREILEGPINNSDHLLSLWVRMLSWAQTKPSSLLVKGVKVELAIGELLFSQARYAAAKRISRRTVQQHLSSLASLGAIRLRCGQHGTIVTIVKYREYYPELYANEPATRPATPAGEVAGSPAGGVAHTKKKELRTYDSNIGEPPVGSPQPGDEQPGLPGLTNPPPNPEEKPKRVRSGKALVKTWEPTHPWDAAFKRLSTAYKWADVFDVKQDAALLDGAMERYGFNKQDMLYLVEELELYLNGEKGHQVKSVRNTFHTFCQTRQKSRLKNGAGATTSNFNRQGWGKGAQASGNLKPGFHARGVDEYKGDADYTTDTAYRMLNEAKAKQAADAANNAVQPQEESVG